MATNKFAALRDTRAGGGTQPVGDMRVSRRGGCWLRLMQHRDTSALY